MGRVIAAATGARTPKLNLGDTSNEVIDEVLRAQIEANWAAIKPTVEAMARLRARLTDPALARHSRRPEAEARLTALEAEIDTVMRQIGRDWQLASEAACDAMAADGWPAATCGVGFGVKLIREAIEALPGGAD